MRITQRIGGILGIHTVDAGLPDPVLRRNGSSWLTAAGDAAAGAGHDLHKVEICLACPHLFTKLAGVAQAVSDDNFDVACAGNINGCPFDAF